MQPTSDGRLAYHVIHLRASDGRFHQKPIAPWHQMVGYPTHYPWFLPNLPYGSDMHATIWCPPRTRRGRGPVSLCSILSSEARGQRQVVAKWRENFNGASVTSQCMQENASSAASLNFPPPGNYTTWIRAKLCTMTVTRLALYPYLYGSDKPGSMAIFGLFVC